MEITPPRRGSMSLRTIQGRWLWLNYFAPLVLRLSARIAHLNILNSKSNPKSKSGILNLHPQSKIQNPKSKIKNSTLFHNRDRHLRRVLARVVDFVSRYDALCLVVIP